MNHNSNPNSNADWCFARKIRESIFDYRVIRKKWIRNLFGLNVFYYFIRFDHRNFYSTFPEFILRELHWKYSVGFFTIYFFYLYDLVRNHIKTFPIWYSYLRKYFTVKKQLVLVQIVYEFTITIGYSSFANYCVYPSDPQPTKISLLPIPIPMSWSQSSFFLLSHSSSKPWMSPSKTWCKEMHFCSASPSYISPFNSGHGINETFSNNSFFLSFSYSFIYSVFYYYN